MHAMTGPPDTATSVDNELLTQILARRRRHLPTRNETTPCRARACAEGMARAVSVQDDVGGNLARGAGRGYATSPTRRNER